MPQGPRNGTAEAGPLPVETETVSDPSDPSRQRAWIRSRERPLPADPRLHEAALLLMSDLTLLWPALLVHGFGRAEHRHTALVPLTLTMWFHRRAPADDRNGTSTTTAGSAVDDPCRAGRCSARSRHRRAPYGVTCCGRRTPRW
jgi:acyl-CoA thioesterase